MEKRKVAVVFCVALGLAMSFGGCGEEPEPSQPEAVTGPPSVMGDPPGAMAAPPAVDIQVDETKPLDEIKAEAANMDPAQLRAEAMKYKEASETKFTEFTNINDQIKGIAATEVAKLTELKGNLDECSKSIEALKSRYQVYFDKLKEIGGDISGLEMKIKI